LYSEREKVWAIGFECKVEQANWPFLLTIKNTHDVLLHQVVCLLADSAIALLAIFIEVGLQFDVLMVARQSIVQEKPFQEMDFRKQFVLNVHHLALKILKHFFPVDTP
jgi:hypothetical protein